ncbi:MAG TPA: hypothetical protein ENO22_01390 [candidate division Zixibacteria bacterium]|nr:hypothetical protein [candidate division Zixibacteria bacterium]
MDLRKLVIVLSFVLFTGGVLFFACSSDEEPPVIFPPTDQINVTYIAPGDAPDIDGEPDAIWDAGSLTQLISVDTSEFNPGNDVELVDIIALSDSNYVYIAVSWSDDTRNVRYRQWVWDTVSYNDPNVPYPWRQTFTFKEDNISFFFDPDPSSNGASQSAAEIGPNCALMCHEADLVMYNETGVGVDGWFWRAGVTDPIGRALDLNFVDSLQTDNVFNGLDAVENRGYIPNFEAEVRTPLYTHKVDTTIVGTDTSYTIVNSETLFAEDSVAYLADQLIPAALAEQLDSIFVPGYVLSNQASGSRWDVEAAGSYDVVRKRWTVEFKRALNTGNADDIVFEIDHEYGIAVAIGDNTKHPHTGFDPVLLKF